MKFKKIVGFGDSWMYGDELLDPELPKRWPDAHSCWTQNDPYRHTNCFLGLLGQHYGVPTENFGIAGGSLQSSVWTYLWWFEHEPNPQDCLVLVAHTDSDRLSFYNPTHRSFANDPPWNKFVHSTWVEYGSSVVPEPFRDLSKRHLVLTNCAELCRLNYIQTAMFFDGQAARHNIPMMQFHIMPADQTLDLPTMIWPNFATTMWFRDHPANQRRQLIMPGGHPNEQGHRMIADKLISAIDPAIMRGC
jgi:hypothetical protein